MSQIQNVDSAPDYIMKFIHENMEQICVIYDEGLNNNPDINLSYPTEANEVFATFPRNKIDHLNSEGYSINEDEWDGKAVRLVTAWNTKDHDVEDFLEILKQSN